MNQGIEKGKKEKLNAEERCVMPLCRRRTGVLKSTPINQRTHYIQGCGQVCNSCWSKGNYDNF